MDDDYKELENSCFSITNSEILKSNLVSKLKEYETNESKLILEKLEVHINAINQQIIKNKDKNKIDKLNKKLSELNSQKCSILNKLKNHSRNQSTCLEQLSEKSFDKYKTVVGKVIFIINDTQNKINSLKTVNSLCLLYRRNKIVINNDFSYAPFFLNKEKDNKDLNKCKIEKSIKSNTTQNIIKIKYKKDNFYVPDSTQLRLYKYQKIGVRQLWELHLRNVGGIIADEMGLGKTIQIIAFLSGMYPFPNSHLYQNSNKNKVNPSLIICPPTIMQQWKAEFNNQAPQFNIHFLHDTGNNYCSYFDTLEKLFKSNNNMFEIVLTSYEIVHRYESYIIHKHQNYVILDEGHKIRNPDSKIAISVKHFLTPHRIILTGAPIQNSLRELQSLFDFVYPGRLGTLPVFEAEFCIPIRIGGYRGSSIEEIQMSYRCANMLRDIISPYILRRVKADVAEHIKITKKSEQILFCNLTSDQIYEYKKVINNLAIDKLAHYSNSRKLVFQVISDLRKICNHSDLLQVHNFNKPPSYGCIDKSCKLKALKTILSMQKRQKHRALIFSQTRQMLDIIEIFMSQENYEYYRLDGSTPIKSRHSIINDFNQNSSVFCFLLTTRTGGLGVNLVGANRVVIFDPDQNPSIDVQARERAYRIGQNKDVKIYRLICRGTIEEKVYHRQIFKKFLTDKVLQDGDYSNQNRFFSKAHLKELFSLNVFECGSNFTETANIFSETLNNSEISKLNYENNLSKNLPSSSKNRKRKYSDKDLIEMLFSDNITSIMSHDKIVKSSKNLNEKIVVKKSAVRAADLALGALKRSFKEVKQAPVGIPTQTGKKGAAGLLKFNELATKSNQNPGYSFNKSSIKNFSNVLATNLREFLINHNSQSCSSSEIINEFQNQLNSDRDKYVFRHILRKMCNLVDDQNEFTDTNDKMSLNNFNKRQKTFQKLKQEYL